MEYRSSGRKRFGGGLSQMKLLHSTVPYNFAGIPDPDMASYEKARIVVLPVPFDSTTSFGAGARNGPHAIINASRFMEWYDEEIDFEAAKQGIATLEELEPVRANAEETVKRVEEVVEKILGDKKFPVVLGGEHTISCGAVNAVKKLEKDFSVLSFDAHADLRDEYEGSKFSHACTASRIS